MAARVPLESIQKLILFDGHLTKSRRTTPVPQLECTGSVCNDYQPASVLCINNGGTHTDIDWTCEADLPSSLRFGPLRVSCEGWDGPGDPYVLRGSCGLTYSLVRTPRYGSTHSPRLNYTYIFGIVLVALAIIFLYRSALRFLNPATSSQRGTDRGGGPGSSSAYRGPPPPPYTKYASQPWTPGFWTGLGAGGLAAGMYNYITRPRPQQDSTYDWERPVFGTRTRSAAQPESSAFRRAGSSTGPGTQLGEMRRATGYASSSVR